MPIHRMSVSKRYPLRTCYRVKPALCRRAGAPYAGRMSLVAADTTFLDLPDRGRDLLERVSERARGLLGATLRTVRDDGLVALRITEVEAYGGGFDPASHAYRGPNARNRSMFGPPLHGYVYRHMGLHNCFNVVVSVDGTPTGVLVRAGEIVEGEAVARCRRSERGSTRSSIDLAAGPARLTVALGITLADDGLPLDGSSGLELEPRAVPEPAISVGERIGVGKARDFPLRFWVTGHPTVSR